MYALDHSNIIDSNWLEVSIGVEEFMPVSEINPSCANRNKSRLLFSSAEMFKNPL